MKPMFWLIFASLVPVLLFVQATQGAGEKRRRPRELGIRIGVLPTGPYNAITDVAGVKVGHLTMKEGETIRTGVTIVLPHDGNLFQEKVPGAIYVANGYGKLAGLSQVEEIGTIETPIAVTNTLSVGAAMEGIARYMLALPGNADLVSINPVVGEINDGYLNDIRGMHIRPNHVIQAVKNAKGGPVEEGSVGAGHGARAMGYKSGIGTSSRVLPAQQGGYAIGVLVDANFGGHLIVGGVPVGRLLKKRAPETAQAAEEEEKGSCIIVVATDAPVGAKSLKRIALRANLALGKVGSSAGNRSGDYVIAFSTEASLRVKEGAEFVGGQELEGNQLNPLFEAAVEATEEALLDALFMATAVQGREGHRIDPVPQDEVLRIMREYRALNP